VSDLPRLFLTQYPVRCRSCEERYFVSFLIAWKLYAAARTRRNERRRKDSTSA
jgi:hypothetical protein